MKYTIKGTDRIPEGAFVNLAAAGRVVDGAGAPHYRLTRGQKIEGCEIPEPDRLQAAAAAGLLTVEEESPKEAPAMKKPVVA